MKLVNKKVFILVALLGTVGSGFARVTESEQFIGLTNMELKQRLANLDELYLNLLGTVLGKGGSYSRSRDPKAIKLLEDKKTSFDNVTYNYTKNLLEQGLNEEALEILEAYTSDLTRVAQSRGIVLESKVKPSDEQEALLKELEELAK